MIDRSILTINTPATSFALTTKEAVKLDLGITGSTDDTLINTYILACSKQLANACNRVFGEEVVSEKFRFSSSKEAVILSRRAVESVTSVIEDDVLLVAADYELDKEAGLLYRLDDDEPLTWFATKLVVVYTAGWDLPTEAPEDLAKAAVALVKAQYLSKGRDPLIRSENVPGVYEVAYWVGNIPGSEAWPKDIMSAINAYRDPFVTAGA